MQPKWIWYQWYKEAPNMTCQICGQNNMTANETSRTWTTGMIISRRERGLETYPNVVPVCMTCGQIMQVENAGVIDYMVYIGKLSELEGNNMKRQTYEEMMRYDSVCPIRKRNGQKCTRMKCTKDIHMCEVHYNDTNQQTEYSTPMQLDQPNYNNINPTASNSYYF